MKDLRPLGGNDVGDVGAALLRAGRTAGPSVAARQRALEALGLDAATTAAGTAAAVGTTKAAGAVAAAGATKWIAAAVVIALGGTVGIYAVSRSTAGADLPSPSSATAAATAAPVLGAASVPAAQVGQASAASSRPGLSEEVTRLDRARSSIKANEPRRALAEIEDYRRVFPRGLLTPEATVLEIEAHARSGDHRAATVLARRFLTANPASPHAERVRVFAGGP